MMQSIPYDPSLALGSVVCPKALENFRDLSEKDRMVKAAKYKLEAVIESKRSLEKTLVEISSLGIRGSEDALKVAIMSADQKIRIATNSLVSAHIDNESDARGFDQEQSSHVGLDQVSPIDLGRSKSIKLPTAVDSIRITAQFFPFSEDGSKEVTDRMADYASNSARFLGAKRSMDIGAAVQGQISDQQNIFNTQGTLIITATCMHKCELYFSPLVFDPDATLRSWNKLFPDNAMPIMDKERLVNIAKGATKVDETIKLTVCSGAGYGSSFVGMVHMLSGKDGMASPAGMRMNGLSDVKKMLYSSQKNISHCSVVTTGVLPKLQLSEDEENNVLLDSQSLIAAFDDYINKVEAGNIGIPIWYYLSSLEADQVAEIWCDKYQPDWRDNIAEKINE